MSEKSIVLHGGPMKTGSSAIQVFLYQNKRELADKGIYYRFIPNSAIIKTLRADENLFTEQKVVLSGEFLCYYPHAVRMFIEEYDFKVTVILVLRPLFETYISLYLQNLKGPMKRTTGFDEFVDEQFARDRDPESMRGTHYNFGLLHDSLKAAGANVLWLKYSRKDLISDIAKTVSETFQLPIAWNKFVVPKTKNVSPLRSLNLPTAGVAVTINSLAKQELISEDERETLLTSLLDACEIMKLRNEDYVDPKLRSKIEEFDQSNNAEFYEKVLKI